eukprot:30992-Pelagococcus_subviridis.AAC.14
MRGQYLVRDAPAVEQDESAFARGDVYRAACAAAVFAPPHDPKAPAARLLPPVVHVHDRGDRAVARARANLALEVPRVVRVVVEMRDVPRAGARVVGEHQTRRRRRRLQSRARLLRGGRLLLRNALKSTVFFIVFSPAPASPRPERVRDREQELRQRSDPPVRAPPPRQRRGVEHADEVVASVLPQRLHLPVRLERLARLSRRGEELEREDVVEDDEPVLAQRFRRVRGDHDARDVRHRRLPSASRRPLSCALFYSSSSSRAAGFGFVLRGVPGRDAPELRDPRRRGGSERGLPRRFRQRRARDAELRRRARERSRRGGDRFPRALRRPDVRDVVVAVAAVAAQ